MNQRDQKELEKRLDDPEFFELYEQLIALEFFGKRFVSTSRLPKAGDIEKGDSSLIAVIPQPGEKPEEVIARARDYNKEATWLAHRLSKFFPADRRDYWQEIFISQAMGGDTTVLQHQRGGRRDSLTEDEINERLKILADVEATKKRLKITFDQACARLSEKYNQHLIWSTVKKWRKYRNRKNRPRNDQ